MNPKLRQDGKGEESFFSSETDALIRLEKITKYYGSLKALEDLDFDLVPGEVHVLFGENGAGKSTIVKILTGTQGFSSGRFELFGQEQQRLTPAEAQRAGVRAVFQEFSLIPELTVTENIFLGHELTRLGRINNEEMIKRVVSILERLDFHLDPKQKVGSLIRAHQQMVEIAKTLLFDCRVLILDEPTASLTDDESQRLFEIVEELRDHGLGIVYVSHRISEIERLADRITVLRDRRSVATIPGQGADKTRLIELMTGRKFDKFYPHIPHQPGKAGLSLENVSLKDDKAVGIALEARKGEVLGIAGLAGCGKSSVLRAVYGLETLVSGEIRKGTSRLEVNGPAEALASGIVYFPSDRTVEGLAMQQSLVENSLIAALSDEKFANFKMAIKPAERTRFWDSVAEYLSISARKREATAEELSGGNRQKLMIARGLSRDFDVFLFDEPTVGVDVQAKLEIYQMIKSLTEDGKIVVIASSDLAEVIHVAHRVLVMHDGHVVGEIEGDHISEEAILSRFFKHGTDSDVDQRETA